MSFLPDEPTKIHLISKCSSTFLSRVTNLHDTPGTINNPNSFLTSFSAPLGCAHIQGITRVMTELKMQPTIHLQSKPGFGRGKYPGLLCKCIVGCISNSVGFIITCEIPCMKPPVINYNILDKVK
jgi:hypothetical protein